MAITPMDRLSGGGRVNRVFTQLTKVTTSSLPWPTVYYLHCLALTLQCSTSNLQGMLTGKSYFPNKFCETPGDNVQKFKVIIRRLPQKKTPNSILSNKPSFFKKKPWLIYILSERCRDNDRVLPFTGLLPKCP